MHQIRGDIGWGKTHLCVADQLINHYEARLPTINRHEETTVREKNPIKKEGQHYWLQVTQELKKSILSYLSV
jgi:hypothetical protein